MKCRLPMKIGTPSGGGTSYPDGAFIPVTKFTAGKSYALVAKIDGVYRYINTTAFNNYTLNATELSVTPGGGYVTFGSEPALFKAEASGDGFTLGNGSNFLHGTSSGGTALRVGTTSAVWKVDTSETGGFDSGKYLPKEVSSSVWLKNTTGGYDWCIKYESAGSFGYDRAGRDSTYSTGFVSFILYEKYEGGSGGSGGSGGGASEYAVNISDSVDFFNDIVSWGGASITVGSQAISKAGAVVAAANANLTINVNHSDMIEWRVTVNEQVVKAATSSSGSYSHTITANTNLSLSHDSNGLFTFAITTE